MPKDISASVRQQLLNKARSDRRPFDELFQYFVIERFLYQLSTSGDEVNPQPETGLYPTVLGHAAPDLLLYPPETVFAEKLEAMIKLGSLNSRMKDFFDLWRMAQ